jgi:formylglycine-generating enzyme required for sulfatase activity
VGNGDFKDEVCIPGGPFLMGCDPDEGVAGERPKHNVQLTPYLIDVYEVTNARYRACVDDGVCTAPLAGSTYFTTGLDALPVAGVSWDQATVFCDWDGGRHLPSEAQWEKAARGPAPSEVNMPWGADPPTCDLTIGEGCLYSGLAQPWPVDARPAGASFYGVQQMAGNVDEWCQDYSSASYYSVSPLLDPPGPATGTHRIIRGMNFSVSLAAQAESVFARMGTSATTQRSSLGIRCARRGF